MTDIHLVVPPLHEAGEIVVHVVEYHVDAALHVVGFECCKQRDDVRWCNRCRPAAGGHPRPRAVRETQALLHTSAVVCKSIQGGQLCCALIGRLAFSSGPRSLSLQY